MKHGHFSEKHWGYLACLSMLLIALLCLPLISPRAQITLKGLEEYEELQEYVQTTVIQPAKEKNEDTTILQIANIQAKIKKALEAKGYYDAHITYHKEQATDDSAENIIYNIRPNKAYTISTITINGYDKDGGITLNEGDILNAAGVLKAQSQLEKYIGENECIYNLATAHKVILDTEKQTGRIIFDVTGDDNAKFGATTLEGANDIDREYLRKFITYNEDTCWNPAQIEKTRTSLIQTGLISSVEVKLPKDLPASGTVPILFNLKERDTRKVRTGLFYSTYEGPGIMGEWTHSNFFGKGEELSVHSRFSSLIQSLGFDFKKPFFLSDKQNLNISSEFRTEDTDAFKGTTLTSGIFIDRELSRYWTGGLGVGLELSEIEEQDDTETFGLVSFPAGLTYDSRDNELDPHDGHLFSITATPFLDVLGEASPFYKTQVTGTAYFDMSDSVYDPVLALRASLGTIWGASTDNIPATKRFFAGGGGSIRGYGYQEAGPFEDGDPKGGRSLIETNAEFRVKFTETIGTVAFVDAGGVYDEVYPSFKEDVYVGAGLGMRYYSSFGPIRFDVALPLTNKEELDQNYQIYISIGQAF